MTFNPVPKPEKQDKKPKKSIAPHSAKRKEDNELYSFLAKKFKDDNKKCAVCQVNNTQHIHHKAGRIGFFDYWSEWLGVNLLLDIRFWLPICATCHDKVENYPEWSYEKGYSIKRNHKK